jgi:hypothetical protein
MINMQTSSPALAVTAAKVVIAAPAARDIGAALRKTFKPFAIIPDRWGQLLDCLD